MARAYGAIESESRTVKGQLECTVSIVNRKSFRGCTFVQIFALRDRQVESWFRGIACGIIILRPNVVAYILNQEGNGNSQPLIYDGAFDQLSQKLALPCSCVSHQIIILSLLSLSLNC